MKKLIFAATASAFLCASAFAAPVPTSTATGMKSVSGFTEQVKMSKKMMMMKKKKMMMKKKMM